MFYRAVLLAGVGVVLALGGCMNKTPSKELFGACVYEESYPKIYEQLGFSNYKVIGLQCIPYGSYGFKADHLFILQCTAISRVRTVYSSTLLDESPYAKVIIRYQFDNKDTIKEWWDYEHHGKGYPTIYSKLGEEFLNAMKSAKKLTYSFTGESYEIDLTKASEGVRKFETECNALNVREG